MEIKTPPKIDAYAYHICRAWDNGSYTMATKPIKFFELHNTITQFFWVRLCSIEFGNRTIAELFDWIGRDYTDKTLSTFENTQEM